MPTRGQEKLAILQEAWAGCAGEWKSSELYLKLSSRTSHSSFGARVWMTRGQLAQKYNSESIADTITQAKLDDPKLADTCVKWHPDAIGNKDTLGIIFFRTVHACTLEFYMLSVTNTNTIQHVTSLAALFPPTAQLNFHIYMSKCKLARRTCSCSCAGTQKELKNVQTQWSRSCSIVWTKTSATGNADHGKRRQRKRRDATVPAVTMKTASPLLRSAMLLPAVRPVTHVCSTSGIIHIFGHSSRWKLIKMFKMFKRWLEKPKNNFRTTIGDTAEYV